MFAQNWLDAKEAVKLLAPVVTEQDSNGISLYFFSNGYKSYHNVTDASKVMELFDQNKPGGGTQLTNVLEDAIRPDTPGRSETILIITDGEPNNIHNVENTIID
jgi:uncharacterized protein with von Willebrand factor type A (vWA) domain